MKIALLGEYDPSYEPHQATARAVDHAASSLQASVSHQWISTGDIADHRIDDFDGWWVAPGSPYRDMEQTLRLIQHARTSGVPCFGTCGGFQHMVIEFARNVLGIEDAAHAEYDPEASRLIVSRLDCSLAGKKMTITLAPDSEVANIYGATTAEENYYCNFGINPEFAKPISDGGFRIVASDTDGDARVMEIADHRFFIGTLFVPQMRSTSAQPHPLVVAFVQAALNHAQDRTTSAPS